jgi:hypothetical protein
MAEPLFQKKPLYYLSGALALALVGLVNPWVMPQWEQWGLLPAVPPQFMHANDLKIGIPLSLDILLGLYAGIVMFHPKPWKQLFRESVGLNACLLVALFLLQLSSNVILPGKFRFFRLALMLLQMLMMAKLLYLIAVKPANGKPASGRVRNLSTLVFGVVMVLGVMESGAMFLVDTHRFNGTLASRAWFMRHWELNAEGYRDVDHDPKQVAKRKKVVVLGDSFVAGHGIANPADRFSDRLGSLLGPSFEVFNLGVGGSDLRDGYDRLLQFPHEIDILVYSYYPNDIEQDGERGGLVLQRAKSYDDIPAWLRYVVRRSYLLNYLYWRLPHPHELTDYKGYVKQCYATPSVLSQHLQVMDSLASFADRKGARFATVVFPFLEDAAQSEFATQPALERFRQLGLPVLDVRSWMLNRPALDFIVNQNDPHPNEYLHGLVADSLHRLMVDSAWLKP